MILSISAARFICISFAVRRAGSAARVISLRICAVRFSTTIGNTTSETSDTMMKATGRTVVHVLSGPTRQMLRRSGGRFAANEPPSWTSATSPAICLPSPSAIIGAMSERREFQRLHLAKPILAVLNGEQNALILDIGVGGGLIEHHGAVKSGDRFKIAFRWKGEDVRFHCEVARSRIVRERP